MLECEKCGKFFRDRWNLSAHMSRITPCTKENGKNNLAHEVKKDTLEAKKDTLEAKKDTLEAKKDILEAKKDISKQCKFCLTNLCNKKYLKIHENICKQRDDPTRLFEIENNIEPVLPDCKTECRYCNKNFSRTALLNKHIPICKEKEEYHQILLKQKNNQVIQNQNNIQTQNNIQNQNNNINIYFNENTIPFGSKRLTDHITADKLVEILRTSYRQYGKDHDYEIAGEILLRLEECLQEVPENRNYLIDEKSSIWSIKTNNGLKYIDKDKCMHSIVKENAGILCDKKEEINISNSQVLKNKTIADAFIHEKQFHKKGIHYSPYGERKINTIKKGLQIVNKNIEVPF